MRRFVVKVLAVAGLSIFLFSGIGNADDLNKLFKQVEKFKLERKGYILGAKLNKKQLKTAKSNPEKAAAKDTFKFRDNNLFVVAQLGSNRIVLIYEQFKQVGQQQRKDLVGDLSMSFEDPTVMAHDKIIYWAWAQKGKISSREFDSAKDAKKKLDILATVKCVSDIEIMAKQKEALTGDIYYIISSDPILTFFADQNS